MRVNSPSIAFASLHLPRERFAVLYAAPYATLYVLLASVWAQEETSDNDERYLMALAAVALGHALLVLSVQWSVAARAVVTCRNEKSVQKARLIRVVPIEHHGKAAMCPLEVREIDGRRRIVFSFQRRRFVYEETTDTFERMRFPVENRTIESFANENGYASADAVSTAGAKWGTNSLEIPMPEFADLFKEHAVAPFFVFQIFCVILWCFDEYWYVSIFTLVMLIAFESTVVMQRLKNVRELRKMSPKPYPIHVYRAKKWEQIPSDQVVAGDIVSIVRSSEDADRGVACDVLLLSGTCIVNEAMLTGESVPQTKDNIGNATPGKLDVKNIHKGCVVFGGTKIVQTNQSEQPSRFTPPDRGCVGYALRTGFDTTQGRLVRTIIFSTEHVTANNLESLVIIVFLMVFAVAASLFVWNHGTLHNRSRYKLLLHCIMIVTSVIPPELPMQLALTVNQSLMALSQLAIFCTEPFRIPFAGKVDICCFDKTGTLTTDKMILEGMAGLEADTSTQLTPLSAVRAEVTLALAACHSLAPLDDGSIVGDPLEKAILEAMDWTFTKSHVAIPKKGPRRVVKVLRRFAFSSAVKRMAVIAQCETDQGTSAFIAVKGAPEVLASRFVTKPSNYESLQHHFSSEGKRVLALGRRALSGDVSSSLIAKMEREDVERDLEFVGFLVVSTPIKPDAEESLRLLRQSSHRLIMITGDNARTGAYVARAVHIVDRQCAFLDVRPGAATDHPKATDLVWLDDRDQPTDAFADDAKAKQAFERHFYDDDVCVTGAALAAFQESPALAKYKHLLAHIRVYARTSPDQKEWVLMSLKQLGYGTLMCGDGTNDVGALKQAHVGIALLDSKPEDTAKLLADAKKSPLQKQREMMARQRAALATARSASTAAGVPPRQPSSFSEALQMAREQVEEQRRLQAEAQRLMKEGKGARASGDTPTAVALNKMLEDMENDVPIVKLGDASIAAPFTSKISDLGSVCNIVRQGRSTLVTTLQMYKIMSLNSLITAYSLSVMNLDGIKFGQAQHMISGILMMICLLSLSRASPAERLSRQRPTSSIFNGAFLLSVLGQFAVHIYCLVAVARLAKGIGHVSVTDGTFVATDEELEKEFEPSLLNNGIYIITLAMHVATFGINYQGRPFRESLTENRPLFYSLAAVYMLALVAAGGYLGAFEDLGFVTFPEEFKGPLMLYVLADLVACWAIDRGASALFTRGAPRRELRLTYLS